MPHNCVHFCHPVAFSPSCKVIFCLIGGAVQGCSSSCSPSKKYMKMWFSPYFLVLAIFEKNRRKKKRPRNGWSCCCAAISKGQICICVYFSYIYCGFKRKKQCCCFPTFIKSSTSPFCKLKSLETLSRLKNKKTTKNANRQVAKKCRFLDILNISEDSFASKLFTLSTVPHFYHLKTEMLLLCDNVTRSNSSEVESCRPQ